MTLRKLQCSERLCATMTCALRNVFHVKRRLELWSRMNTTVAVRTATDWRRTLRAGPQPRPPAVLRAGLFGLLRLPEGLPRPRTSTMNGSPRCVSRETPWDQPSYRMNAVIVWSANSTTQGRKAVRADSNRGSLPQSLSRVTGNAPASREGQHVRELPPTNVVRCPRCVLVARRASLR